MALIELYFVLFYFILCTCTLNKIILIPPKFKIPMISTRRMFLIYYFHEIDVELDTLRKY